VSKIKAIAIRHKSREPMLSLDNARVTVANGILGDFRGAQPDRQITILSESAWRKTCESIDADLPWTTRRANLLLDGVEFGPADVGKKVRIGALELIITRQTDPCSRMDQQRQGLKAALTPDWRGGVCCNVVEPGEIQIGDEVEIG
jgi:MOSC domain-containing protein YiiM